MSTPRFVQEAHERAVKAEARAEAAERLVERAKESIEKQDAALRATVDEMERRGAEIERLRAAATALWKVVEATHDHHAWLAPLADLRKALEGGE